MQQKLYLLFNQSQLEESTEVYFLFEHKKPSRDFVFENLKKTAFLEYFCHRIFAYFLFRFDSLYLVTYMSNCNDNIIELNWEFIWF